LSDPKARPRPFVKDFKSGAKAAGSVLWNGWKDGVTGLIRQPHAGYKRHGILGGAAGSIIATVNICMKPTVGTLASVTWLGRGTYASVRDVVRNYKQEGRRMSPTLFDVASSLSTASNSQTQDDEDTEISSAAKTAANISGFHPKVCQHIIHEFEKIKIDHEQKLASSPSKKRNPMSLFCHNNKNKRSPSPNRRHDS
jgi:hypothetical protein